MYLQINTVNGNARNSCAHLIKVGVGFRFAHAVEVLHVNELEVIGESGVRSLKFWQELNMRKVAQLLITPVVQVTQTVREAREEVRHIQNTETFRDLAYCKIQAKVL